MFRCIDIFRYDMETADHKLKDYLEDILPYLENHNFFMCQVKLLALVYITSLLPTSVYIMYNLVSGNNSKVKWWAVEPTL